MILIKKNIIIFSPPKPHFFVILTKMWNNSEKGISLIIKIQHKYTIIIFIRKISLFFIFFKFCSVFRWKESDI